MKESESGLAFLVLVVEVYFKLPHFIAVMQLGVSKQSGYLCQHCNSMYMEKPETAAIP